MGNVQCKRNTNETKNGTQVKILLLLWPVDFSFTAARSMETIDMMKVENSTLVFITISTWMHQRATEAQAWEAGNM